MREMQKVLQLGNIYKDLPKREIILHYRVQHTLTNRRSSRKRLRKGHSTASFNAYLILKLFLVLLLLLSGDIHLNPGPGEHKQGKINYKDLNIASWNVQTLLNDTCTFGRRTAIIGTELAKYNIDIAALSETRIAGKDQVIEEKGAGYTFFTTGKPEGETRMAGTGFAIKNCLLSKLGDQKPHGISPRLSTLKIQMTKNQAAHFISAYAPTLDSPEEDKDAFYEQLSTLLNSIPYKDKIFLLGDFNARVGRDHQTWNKVLGKNGVGSTNSSGFRLLSLCTEQKLVITNTVFQQAHRHKTTWMHPRSKRWHLIDYVITRQRDLSEVKLTRSLPMSTIWTDHRLVRSNIAIKVLPRRRHTQVKPHKKLDTSSLKTAEKCRELSTNLSKALSQTEPKDTPTAEWESIRDATLNVAETTLGHKAKKHQDWFDEQDAKIKPLLQEVHQRHSDWITDKENVSKQDLYHTKKHEVQRSLREMKDQWFSMRAVEIQDAADRHDTKGYFKGLKKIYGPKQSCTAAIKDTRPLG